MGGNRNNMILAIALSALVIFAWQYFVVAPQMKADQARQTALAHQEKKPAGAPGTTTAATTAAPTAAPNVPDMAGSTVHMTREAALKASGARVAIDSPLLDGSIALKGAKLDDLRLKKYHETTDPKSPEIVLLAPKNTEYPYYAEFGWIGANGPSDQSVWTQVGSGALSPGHPVTLTWDNGHGLVFTRVITVDDQYMFTVTDHVANKSGTAQTLYPFAYVAREGTPTERTSWVLHMGFVGVADGSEIDGNYTDFKEADAPPKKFSSTGGWVGITDKYWMAAVIPPQNATLSRRLSGLDLERRGQGLSGQLPSSRAGHRAGRPGPEPPTGCSPAPRWWTYCAAMNGRHGITRFDNAVDWGWFWFLTQPLFWLLDNFYKFIGNFGLAILMLTVVVKLLFFPLANASFKSMSKMKKVQPQMEEIKQAAQGGSAAPAAGNDGALQAREGQSADRLPADADPDPGVLLALQGALRHHRNAPGALLWLDPRPVGARSHLDPQSVRAPALSHSGLRAGLCSPSGSGRS